MTANASARSLAITVLFATCLSAGTSALELKSQAESWGVQNEVPTVLSGKVVDIACELTKDCPARCGGGQRQLGVLSTDGKLVLVGKNSQPLFNGGVPDLLQYCQQMVDVDGLMTGNERNRMFQLQFIRVKGTQAWSKAENWTKVWQERNPTLADKADEWFQHDPRVRKQIDSTGYLGLGAAADREFARTR